MNVNEATREQLEEIAQIDGVRAASLIEHRRSYGPFRSWEEVREVPTFDEHMVRRIRDAGFTIGGGVRENER